MPPKLKLKLKMDKNIKLLATIAGVFVLIIAVVIVVRIFAPHPPSQSQIAKADLASSTKQTTCPDGMFCKMTSSQKEIIDPSQAVVQRDYRVLNDPLYPPLNRSDTMNTANIIENTAAGNWNVPTKQSNDSYRLVGYVVSQEERKDAGGNNWKLFARQKDRNNSDFYMMPANNNYDVKIAITDDTVLGQKLRDVYSIPNELRFSSPMLNQGSYQFVEMPKTDFTSSWYV